MPRSIDVVLGESPKWDVSVHASGRLMGLAVWKNTVIVVGGDEGPSSTDGTTVTTWIDLETGHAMSGPRLTTGRKSCTAVVARHKLFVFGGYHGAGDALLDSCEMLDLEGEGGGFVQLHDCKLPKGMMNMVGWNNNDEEILIIGGWNGTNYSDCFLSLHLDTLTIHVLPSLHTRRALPVVVRRRDTLLIVGGKFGNNTYSSSTECFDLATREWVSDPPIPPLPNPDHLFFGFVTNDDDDDDADMDILVVRLARGHAMYSWYDQRWVYSRDNNNNKEPRHRPMSRWDLVVVSTLHSCLLWAPSTKRTLQCRTYRVVPMDEEENKPQYTTTTAPELSSITTRTALDAQIQKCRTIIDAAEIDISNLVLLEEAIAAEAGLVRLNAMLPMFPTLASLRAQHEKMQQICLSLPLQERREIVPKLRKLEQQIECETKAQEELALPKATHCHPENRANFLMHGNKNVSAMTTPVEVIAAPAMTTAKNRRGSVFLSYTGQDKDARTFTAHLCDSLRSNHINCFYDAWSLQVGQEWEREIEDHVKTCRVFVCILSTNYTRRYWCMRELDLALQFRRMIIPVFYNYQLPDPTVEFCNDLIEAHTASRDPQRRRELDDATLQRWCDNIRRLLTLQGIRNESTSKDSDVTLKHRTVQVIQSYL